jgi:hypothetical protein
MKAIINASNFSQYSKYNGLTLKVEFVDSTDVYFLVNKEYINLPFNEVFIVDIQKEYNKILNLIKSEVGGGQLELEALNYYIKAKKIKF